MRKRQAKQGRANTEEALEASILELVDAAVDPSLLEPIKETILKVDGVKGCHWLRGRKAGTSLNIDVHIEEMSLEYLMLHYLQGRVLLQVQVSMSPEILIRDAMDIAKQAEEEILKADGSISQVSVQLRLGQQIQQLQLAASKNGASNLQAETQ